MYKPKFFKYSDNGVFPPKTILKVFVPMGLAIPATISWADSIFKAATGLDPMKTPNIGCAVIAA